MTTFVLKKYEEQPLSPNTAEVDKPQPPQAGTAAPVKEINILVQGSIAEIVGAALRKVLGRDVEITEVTDSSDASVKALSTEAINTDPLATFRSIQANDAVFIQNSSISQATPEYLSTCIVTDPNYNNEDIRMDNVLGKLALIVEGLEKEIKDHQDHKRINKYRELEVTASNEDGIVL